LPRLAKGSNLRLKVLATEDIAHPIDSAGIASLADEYWTLAEQETGLRKRGLQLRAVHWYQVALPRLPGGFAKLQAERRTAEANRIYGDVLVQQALAMMSESTAAIQSEG
jgi:hypothetical protein